MSARTGSAIACRTLEALRVTHVFGVPGTQTVGLFEALRTSALRTILSAHEQGAAFMANGYARASRRVGVICTIPGPGFTNALTGLAEAQADSAAVMLLTVKPPSSGRRFELQRIDQAQIAAPLVKEVFEATCAGDIAGVLADAHRCALAGEPGPVLVEIAGAALDAEAPDTSHGAVASDDAAAPDDSAHEGLLAAAAQRLLMARRPVIFAGQGAAGDSRALGALAERCAVPVLTTPSGRGVLPEDHAFSLGCEPHRGNLEHANALLRSADLIVALGCKLGHNGSVGFGLALPADRLVHVNTDPAAIGANYPVALGVPVSACVFLSYVSAQARRGRGASTWTQAEVAEWRTKLGALGARGVPEPKIHGVEGGTPAALFAALRAALPRDGIVVTDSGLHQQLLRRQFTVLAPGGLIMPADYQSMGFGVPAAIGAALAAPERPVVAVAGDGGFMMSGMELAAAVRERIPVTVLVMNDGQLGQIRLQQLRDFGHAHAVDVGTPDLEAFAVAIGAGYARLAGNAEAVLRSAIASRRQTLVEVAVGDSAATRRLHASGMARAGARSILPPRLIAALKRLIPLR